MKGGGTAIVFALDGTLVDTDPAGLLAHMDESACGRSRLAAAKQRRGLLGRQRVYAQAGAQLESRCPG